MLHRDRKVLYAPFPVPQCLNSKRSEWALPLHNAAYHGKMKAIEILYDVCPEAILVGTRRGDSPLDLGRKSSDETVRRFPTVEKF